MRETLTALGVMSRPSLDGLSLAMLSTDGDDIVEAGPALHIPYSRELKIFIRRAIKAAVEGRDGADDIGRAAGEVTHAHIDAVEVFLERHRVKRKDIDVIGFHGHTILHRPPAGADALGRTWQIGDGGRLAEDARIDVVSDFRTADVAAGGVGAPFAPAYHRARVAAMEDRPDCAVGIVRLDDRATLTYMPENASAMDLLAFDCGPGIGFVEAWIARRTGDIADVETVLSRPGVVDEDALRLMLLNPFMRRSPPKSLERNDFKTDAAKSLSVADGAATLCALVADCIGTSERFMAEPPGGYIICGEGRRNAAMMDMLRQRLEADVVSAEDAGWRGDALDAECIAYLAVRSLKKLPLSYPKTTRVRAPMRGGVFHRAPVQGGWGAALLKPSIPRAALPPP